jgi:PAP2 superfamily
MTLLLPLPAAPRATQDGSRPASAAPRRLNLGFAARQALLLAGAVAVYFLVRSLTAGRASVAEDNAWFIVELERSLGLFVERDVQAFVLEQDWVVPVFNGIYIYGHWPVIAAVLGWLAWRRRDAFVVYRNVLLVSGLVGMVIVASFPVAPPRLMDLGFVDTVTLHAEAYRVLQPPSLTNQYAAMPSFHVGWDLLVGIALVREGGRTWTRVLGTALPLLMLLTVVVTGNHYLVDAIVGDAIVLTALWLCTAWASRGQVGVGPGVIPMVPDGRTTHHGHTNPATEGTP